MQINEKRKDCCGCRICQFICPVKAVSMETDAEGFKYPRIDVSLCIKCRLCHSVCDEAVSIKNDREPVVYAVKARAESIRKQSSSGGVFSVAARYIVEEKAGVVYGVGYNSEIEAEYIRAESCEELEKLRGSKYVQCYLQSSIFDAFVNDIRQARYVLFSGTPCQVSGIKAYTEKMNLDRSRLILCDFVCHGVPSPRIFRAFVSLCESRQNSKVVKYENRPKDTGWGHQEKISYANGIKDNQSALSQAYKELFYQHYILRPSCHTCDHASMQRCSDFTMGDYWKIKAVCSDFYDDLGVSLCLLNTNQGEKFFQAIKSDIEYMQTIAEDCRQPNLIRPSPHNKYREKFWHNYKRYGIRYVLFRYTEYNLCIRMKNKVKNHLFQVLYRLYKGGKHERRKQNK